MWSTVVLVACLSLATVEEAKRLGFDEVPLWTLSNFLEKRKLWLTCFCLCVTLFVHNFVGLFWILQISGCSQ